MMLKQRLLYLFTRPLIRIEKITVSKYEIKLKRLHLWGWVTEDSQCLNHPWGAPIEKEYGS